eukprot:Gregarina_sp_Poly_1__912@NODE_1219_length_4743_cov_25_233533_g750_i1_p5_GENE_NODE_1219_length_4743_cov_25_233533_g750_i1NODE_1219_length_4743_cov_25_233533_g750_i1_p5_ORF_typecomplete_len138_score8_48zfBED/PF02892_15/0_077zfBED/PF02892_15/1_9zfFCS/PF06467_14/3_1zfFCS/PF06467_14/7_6zfC2H2_3rep/PF18868_1/0_78zfC2H2_3rep/PF18868_1/0_68UBZ_FAAP20/PF15750_5/14UBZ_FAAP20/PF15750_5/7_6zfC2H2_2/PF12756_7/1_4zfC2H2_2/PF12756_7/20zfC4_ClpX/PF06689_13/2_3e02zfC4_ClpX/PF06689_13/17zfC4_ClpX/PF06689_13/75zfC
MCLLSSSIWRGQSGAQSSASTSNKIVTSNSDCWQICDRNPTAVLRCIFCHKEFRSTLEVLALEQVAAHEEVCGSNPRNTCQFCGQKFSAPMDTSPRELRRRINNHYAVCRSSPLNVAEVSSKNESEWMRRSLLYLLF